jgi:hypothetical protein
MGCAGMACIGAAGSEPVSIDSIVVMARPSGSGNTQSRHDWDRTYPVPSESRVAVFPDLVQTPMQLCDVCHNE